MRFVRRLLAAIVFVGVLVLGWTFADDHADLVTIRLPLLDGFTVSLWLALLVAFGTGVAIMATFETYRSMRQGLVARRHRKIIRDLEAEVHQLRNLPLTGDASDADEDSDVESVSPAPKRALGRGA